MIPAEEKGLRLLYLGFAFPPGVQALYPGINPAGHAFETQLVSELRRYFALRSVGVLPVAPPQLEAVDPGSGLSHDVVLLERAPELWYRVRSLSRLKQQYRCWQREGWLADLVLVYNMSPIYNEFLLWLRRQDRCPKLVLLLLDSPSLGQRMPWLKRMRRRCKPMFVPDSEMVTHFDACVGLSRATAKYFEPRGVPFLWMPGGCAPHRAQVDCGQKASESRGPIRFGYYGALGAHAGARRLANVFLAANPPATLEICGYGKAVKEFSDLACHTGNVRFHGLVSPQALRRFEHECDVLVNPRPATHGNENNFSSKLFDYALSGSAILTSRLSGAEAVLGPAAYYFDADDFDASLATQLREMAASPRAELARRGAAVQRKVIHDFSWSTQGQKLAAFMEKLVRARSQDAIAAAEMAA